MAEINPGIEIERTLEEIKDMIAGVIEKIHWIEATLVKVDLKRIRMSVLLNQSRQGRGG